jgi:linoleoyl-CoA desaturase
MSTGDHIRFWAVKVWHTAAFIILPIYVWGLGAYIIGFLIMSVISGFILSIVFQLAHTVEDTEFPMPDEATNRLPDEFAAHQIISLLKAKF